MSFTSANILAVLENIGGYAVVTAGAYWAFWKGIDTFFSSKLSEHKSNLEKANVEHQYKLDKITTEHRIRFESLHAECARVIQKAYVKLMQLDDSLGSTFRRLQLAEEPPLEEKVKLIGECHNDLRTYFRKNRIHFDEETASLLDRVLEVTILAYNEVTTLPIDQRELRDDRTSVKERAEYWNRARSRYENIFKALSSSLENSFRAILGFNT